MKWKPAILWTLRELESIKATDWNEFHGGCLLCEGGCEWFPYSDKKMRSEECLAWLSLHDWYLNDYLWKGRRATILAAWRWLRDYNEWLDKEGI